MSETYADDLDVIFEAQQDFITKRFGDEAFRDANYGWAIDGNTVTTKVYGHGILTSWMEPFGVVHQFEPFDEEGDV